MASGFGHTHTKKHNKGEKKKLWVTKEDDSEDYAEVLSGKGSHRFEIKILKNDEIALAKLAGALTSGPRRQRVENGDIVLVTKASYDTEGKYYITFKYDAEGVKRLKKEKELVFNSPTNEQVISNVIFENEDVVIDEGEGIVDADLVPGTKTITESQYADFDSSFIDGI